MLSTKMTKSKHSWSVQTTKEKLSNGTFLEYLYENELLNDANVLKEVIWSDGITA